MSKPIIPVSVLHEVLICFPYAGTLVWRDRDKSMVARGWITNHGMAIFNAQNADCEAFTSIDSGGYKTGSIFGVQYRAHRVIWAMETGEWPVDQIDHINHDRSDNDIRNLREASQADNNRNRSQLSNNTSGVTGVSWEINRKKWQAYISVNGKQIIIGVFTHKIEAIEARRAAEISHGYHKNHGKQP